MAVRGVGVTDQTAGAGVAEIRARERTVEGGTYAEQYVIPERWRVPSFIGVASTFRTLGNAATPQNIFSIENTTGSGILVCVRSLEAHVDASAASVAVSPNFALSRPAAAPSSGTTLTKVSAGTGEDTAQTSATNVILRGATASDGGAATAITATAGSTAWRMPTTRLHTAVGQVLDTQRDLIPPVLGVEGGIFLRAAEQLLVQIIAAAAADNAATCHYVIDCVWEEYTLP